MCCCCFSFLFVESHKNPSAIESRPCLSGFLLLGFSFFQRSMGATLLTDLPSKLVCSKTKGEGESEIKRSDLNCQ